MRSRLALSLVIGLAIALAGGAPLAKDPRTTRLATGETSRLAESALDAIAAPTDAGAAPSDPAPAPVVAAAGEAPIKSAPPRFQGAAPRPVAPPARISDPPVAAQSARGGTWAVVIGVNDYPGSSDDLYSAVNDANDMVQALSSFGVDPNHTLVLLDGQVNARTLLDSVKWLASNAGPDAVAGFFYAGHVRKTHRGNEEIVTSDGSAVSDQQLAAALSRVQARRSWVGIAGCYGGGFTEVLRPGRVLTGAAPADSLAYENSAIGRSYMVEYMVRQAMILNRASATVQTAFNYAVDRISREHPGREPVQFDSGDGVLDLRPPGAPPASPAEPEPQPEATSPPSESAPPPDEPPASERPGENQKCSGNALFRRCTSG